MGRARKVDDQEQLPGLEDQKDKEVHAAAVRYWERMQERKAAGDEEKAAKDSLVLVMTRKGLTHYKYGEIEVHLDTTTSPKVRRTTPGEEGDDE